MAGVCIRESSFEKELGRTFFKFLCVFNGGNELLIHKQKKKSSDCHCKSRCYVVAIYFGNRAEELLEIRVEHVVVW